MLYLVKLLKALVSMVHPTRFELVTSAFGEHRASLAMAGFCRLTHCKQPEHKVNVVTYRHVCAYSVGTLQKRGNMQLKFGDYQ